jgi:hypothetical protein
MKSIAFALAVVFGLALPADAQQLKLEIKDGRVTLEANGVPARQILAEWARVGGTKVTGADKIAGGPLTLRLAGIPERQALDIILNNVAGFMASERQASAEPGASNYDRIFVLATSAPMPAQAASARPANQPPNSMAGTQRRVPRPPSVPQPVEEVVEDDNNADQEQTAANPNQPVFTFPAPQGGNAVTFGPGNPNGNTTTVFGSPQPGTVAAPVISLQPGANGQPQIYNFVPNGGTAPAQMAPAPTAGFGGAVGSPRPGMIQQPPTPPPPPGQNPRPPGQ